MSKRSKSSKNHSVTGLIVISALPACGQSLDSADPVPDAPIEAAWISTQGTQLAGAGLATPITVQFDGALAPDGSSFTSVSLVHGSLIGRKGTILYQGAALAGARFQASLAGAPFTLKIAGAAVHKNRYDPADPLAAGEYEYRILSGTQDLCRGSTARYFTFACQGGVLAKCSDFGYKPYVQRSGLTLAGKSSSIAGEDLHYVCTRMARADYCMDGVTHTVDNTPIDMYDVFRYRLEAGGLPFEAAWNRNGGVICLAKKRWETIPLGGLGCPSVRDPRTPENKGVQFCDSLLPVSLPKLEDLGAVIYNDSSYLDAGLYLWGNGAEFYTTSRYTDLGVKGATPPKPGYVSFPSSQLGFQGAVFNPKNAPPAGTVALRTYLKDTDYFTTTGTPPAEYVEISLEGYIYPASASPPAGAVPLRSYVGPTGEHLTTSKPTSVPTGYALLALEGYLPR